MTFDALEALTTPLIYKDKEDLLRRKRINEYLLEKVRDKTERSKILSDLGKIFYHSGELDKALEYHENSLILNEELGRKQGIAQEFVSLGNLYRAKGDFDKALEYFEKAFIIFRETGSKMELSRVLMNIGDIFALKRDERGPLDYYLEAQKTAKGSYIFEPINKKLQRLANAKHIQKSTKVKATA